MVVFTCNHCGESLQKPKVDKHYQTVCRRGKNLTCVDCFTDFKDEDYVSHVKCVTEEERYAAKGSMPNGVEKKGETKQQSWNDMIKSIVQKEENLTVPLRNMLHIIGGYTNIPRKKVKFFNFVHNGMPGRFDKQQLESIWELIQKHSALQFPTQQPQTKKSTNPEKQNGESTKGNKRKAESNNNETETDQVPAKKTKKSKKNSENTDTNKHTQENGVNGVNGKDEKTAEENKFSYENKILEVLTAKKQITLKKLQKKVLSAYISHYAVEEHTEKQVKKFNQKLKKMPNVEIKDDLVTLA